MTTGKTLAAASGVTLGLAEFRKTLLSIPRAFGLVWQAGPVLTVALLFINLLLAFVPVATLWLTKLAIDRIVQSVQQAGPGTAEDLHFLWLLLGLLGAVWVTSRALSSLASTLSNVSRLQVEIYVQTFIMRKCANLDLAFFENPQNLDILEKATQGARMSAWNLVWMLFSFARTTVTLAAFLVVLVRLHWLAMLVVAVTTAPQMIASSYFARRHWKIRTDLAEESRLRFYLTGLMTQRDPAKEIRIFSLSEYFMERFRFYWRNFFRREIGLANRREIVNFSLGVLSSLGAVATWIYIASRAVVRTITIGDVVLYTQAVGSCQGNLIELFTQGGQFYEQSLFLGNLFALLDLQPTALEGALRALEPLSPRGRGVGGEGEKAAKPLAPLPQPHSPEGRGETSGTGSRRGGDRPAPATIEQGIEFRNVSFRYPGAEKWVLRNVSFHLPPGHSVALVGRNGAGKTTLVKLLVRLYDPTEGDILLDGHSLREYDLDSLRRLFAVIFQDYTRYFLTLRENVGFGDVQRVDDLARVQQAAEKAGVEEIAKRLPREYETYLARQFMGLGEDLSGGEWQKVALARAYMRDCPILVLDEPTAALDAFAEFELYQSFDKMTVGRLAVFISHRFSTVRMAKYILVLEHGELVEAGNHEELLVRNGLYASMFRTQADRYRDGPPP